MKNLDKKYTHKSHCKGTLAYLIFITKYRKEILTESYSEDIKQYMYDIANYYNWIIIVMETEQDHIHLLIQYPPKECISNIAKILKQQSTWMMWQKYGEYLKNIYWNQMFFGVMVIFMQV